MRVLLEGFKLARGHDTGGVDSYWRNLVPALLRTAPADCRYTLLSAFLHPRRAAELQTHRRTGATIRHWWASPDWLGSAGRAGVPIEWLGGPHDLVHAVEPVWPFQGRSRLVVTLHDLMYHHQPQYLDPRWAARLEKGTEALSARASYWICVSEHTRRDLVTEFGVPVGRTTVVYHGVDPRFARAAEEPGTQEQVRARHQLLDRPYFLFLGSVEPKKNLDMLLRAFGRALGRGLEADLAVAGRAGWQSASVRAAAEALPILARRVRFLGFVPQDDLPFLVAGARALVLPSRYEGFGMPVLEAMAAGAPVLCSNRGALPEVAGGAARIFDADDEDGLAELLAQVDADALLRDNLRAAGRTRALPYTWERCAHATLAAYRQALELPR
ncbi:MAG: glycosyltransferase family 1 protein [Planctomycetota bacterium]|nr:MAG: glycosyltransferase family 1 protein [Planctomycetota bacterium]